MVLDGQRPNAITDVVVSAFQQDGVMFWWISEGEVGTRYCNADLVYEAAATIQP